MSERHFVANLVRRGHAWHWRARVPSAFRRCPDARLSLSFGGCDHKTAASIARHLNRRLHELKHEPRAPMTTRDQLARMMAAERDAEMERLDNAVMARRRYGAGHDVIDVQEDLIHAWAYRLLQRWGVAGRLTFDADCAGRAMLDRDGVGASFIPAIAEAFLSIQDGLRTSVFDDRIRTRLADYEIEDTVPNRERGKAAFFEGRAEALFNYRERYAHVPLGHNPLEDESAVGDRLARRSHIIEHAWKYEAPLPAFTENVADPSTERSHTAQTVGAIDENGDGDGISTPASALIRKAKSETARSQPGTLPVQDEDEAPISLVASDRADAGEAKPRKNGRLLSVSQMLATFEELGKNKLGEKRWTEASANDARRAVKIFVGILEEHGVTHSGEIEQFHIGKLRTHFNEVPTHYGRSSRMARMSTRELREHAAMLQKAALEDGSPPPEIGLASQTIRKHFANLDTFLKYVRGSGYTVLDWTFEGIRPRKPSGGEVRHQTYKPKPDDLKPIFNAPIFAGCAAWNDRGTIGGHVFHDSLYFLPLLFTYLGARRAEVAGLATDDVYEHPEWGWTIHIRTNAFRRIKNVQSDRLLPVPDELIRLNFIAYRDRLKDLDENRMFPELFSHLTDNDPGDRFYDDFHPVMKKALGEAMWKRSVHALRHGFANTLKQQGVPLGIIDDISGRLSEGETSTRYTAAAEIPLMRDAIAKMPIISDHLSPLPVRLLPWVERRDDPPWAREARKPG